jgi:hypothetical protein
VDEHELDSPLKQINVRDHDMRISQRYYEIYPRSDQYSVIGGAPWDFEGIYKLNDEKDFLLLQVTAELILLVWSLRDNEVRCLEREEMEHSHRRELFLSLKDTSHLLELLSFSVLAGLFLCLFKLKN